MHTGLAAPEQVCAGAARSRSCHYGRKHTTQGEYTRVDKALSVKAGLLDGWLQPRGSARMNTSPPVPCPHACTGTMIW